MLRSVKRNDDMGVYPDEMIHCICEAMHNIYHNADCITKGVEKCKNKSWHGAACRWINRPYVWSMS